MESFDRSVSVSEIPFALSILEPSEALHSFADEAKASEGFADMVFADHDEISSREEWSCNAMFKSSAMKDPLDNSALDSCFLKSIANQKRCRNWTDTDRAKHSVYCKGKSRLSKEEKYHIIKMWESKDESSSLQLTQSQIAKLFDKSRSAISKILSPKNIEKIKLEYEAS
eukprot:661738-Hanusia_phi.AAC.2